MSSFDFIIDNIVYSYSSVSNFENCKYGFKLTYIDALPRKNNFFAEFGLLVHECFEKYFLGEVDAFDLPSYYEDNFDQIVKTPPPPYPLNMLETYKAKCLEYFNNFSIERDDYEVILVEDKIEFSINGVAYVAKPDLVLKNKKTGRISMVDYKTSNPFWFDKKKGKEVIDNAKIAGYHKQTYMYTYALKIGRNIQADEITLLFPRAGREITIPWEEEKEKEVIDWLTKTVEKIKNEEEFPYNNSSAYFCDNLCSVRAYCEYR